MGRYSIRVPPKQIKLTCEGCWIQHTAHDVKGSTSISESHILSGAHKLAALLHEHLETVCSLREVRRSTDPQLKKDRQLCLRRKWAWHAKPGLTQKKGKRSQATWAPKANLAPERPEHGHNRNQTLATQGNRNTKTPNARRCLQVES